MKISAGEHITNIHTRASVENAAAAQEPTCHIDLIEWTGTGTRRFFFPPKGKKWRTEQDKIWRIIFSSRNTSTLMLISF